MRLSGITAVAVLTVVVSMFAAAPASAHRGDIWYTTAATLARNIENKYPRVGAARCYPLPAWARAQYNADSFVRGSVRMWDHFLCGIYSTYNDGVCFTVAHITGREWNQFNLTSWRENGCTPWQLR